MQLTRSIKSYMTITLRILNRNHFFCLRLKKNVLSDEMKPITTLVFEPSKDMPFWKLCTIGASDYLMPERDIG